MRVSTAQAYPMNGFNTVLVTGADGFIGRHLVPFLASSGYKVLAASRNPFACEHANITPVRLPDISVTFDWHPMLEQCDVIVHLAGIAHKFANDALYDRTIYRGTAALADAAFERGKHLIFVSSIAAQSGSFSDSELTEDSAPKPINVYGRSKLAAEHSVRTSRVSFTILRPVVIYGDGEKGNFAMIHKLARLPIPLPFGGLTAKRSILSIKNFCTAIATVLTNSSARGETFIVSDPEPLTVAELILRYRISLDRRPMLVPIPEGWIKLALEMVGQNEIWRRIGQPLVAPPTKLLALGWKPS